MNSIREKTDYRARYSTNEFSCDDSQYNFAKMSRDDDEEAGMTQFMVLFAAFTCCFIFGLVVSILALRNRNSNNKPLSKLLLLFTLANLTLFGKYSKSCMRPLILIRDNFI